MYYVYVINNKNNYYIGFTGDIEKRTKEHSRQMGSDIELLYYEAYQDAKQARQRERRLKMYGSAWRGLKQRLGIKTA
jgi:predicted GIY-YIG superfamily endonuclease